MNIDSFLITPKSEGPIGGGAGSGSYPITIAKRTVCREARQQLHNGVLTRSAESRLVDLEDLLEKEMSTDGMMKILEAERWPA